MLAFIKSIRPLNLGIVYLTQVAFYYLFFLAVPWIEPTGNCWMQLNLGSLYIHFFAFVTVIIAASGYLINDYFDFESDLLNQKTNRLSSRTTYLSAYWVSNVIGFLLALYLARSNGQLYLAGIYIAAVAALFLYSAVWKKKVLIGNVVVALFSAFVVVILIYAEKEYLFDLETNTCRRPGISTIQLMLLYSGFIFLISMVREIVKDIEDVNGDAQLGYCTLPIVYGCKAARMIAVIFSIGLLTLLAYWALVMKANAALLAMVYLILLIILPLIYLIFYLMYYSTDFNAAFASKYCKFIMLSGLGFIILSSL